MEPTMKPTIQASACDANRIEDPAGQWAFEYDASQEPLCSSGRKSIYSGVFQEHGLAKTRPCRALAFSPSFPSDYGTECATLGMLSAVGAGPKYLATTYAPIGADPSSVNIIFEEDAGSALADELTGKAFGCAQCEPGDILLHAVGTPEREIENKKILADVFMQIRNAHNAGFFHRDLRCENVCVRRFGPNPSDLKATIIDFELGSRLSAGAPLARAPLFDVLFKRIPSHLANDNISIAPTALELDMGYLAALSYHLERGDLLLSLAKITDATMDDFVDYLKDNITYFGYPSYISPVFSRRLEQERDIAPLARELGLVPADSSAFPENELLAEASSFHKPFLDAEDCSFVDESTAGKLHAMVQELAKAQFESYQELRRSQGKPVEYERMEDQPDDLRNSNFAQVAHIPKKVEALGYVIVPLAECPRELRITSFGDNQIEALARIEHSRWMEERIAQGWKSGERNPEAKTTPYLVPYDDLEEEIKEYDRDAIRQVIPLLERAGFAIARPAGR